MKLDFSNIVTQQLHADVLINKKLELFVLRLDKIHPSISGNKFFKLKYFLEDSIIKNQKTIVTFGGAYSNHLLATAATAKLNGISCVGIVRGETAVKDSTSNHKYSTTLLQCQELGMQLKFISRQEYELKTSPSFIEKIKVEWGDCCIIPEGGYHALGAKGAAEIMNYIAADSSHICCATGTATTVAGLLMQAATHQSIISFPVLKGMTDLKERIGYLTQSSFNNDQLKIMYGYHFGGYAKKTTVLLDFMNALYQQHQLPTDFVYTAKMLFGIFDLIQQDYFAAGSKITAIHTGGLQGNQSLPNNSLTF